MVTEVAKLDTVDALIDSSLRLLVAKRLLPCEVDVFAIPRQVMPYLLHSLSFVNKRISVNPPC